MQPAFAESVQNLILPASGATAERVARGQDVVPFLVARSGAARRNRSWYCAGPTTREDEPRRRRRFAAGLVEVSARAGLTLVRPGPSCPGYCVGFGDAAATPAEKPSSSKREIPPRAVVRWRRIRLRFALEGPNPSKGSGALRDNFVPKWASASDGYCPGDEDRRVREAGARRGRSEADRPADEASRPLGRGRAQPVRRARRRGGAAHQGGGRRRRGRARLARAGEGARVAAQGARDGRRPRRARQRRGGRGLRPGRHEPRRSPPRSSARRRPRPLRPAVERLRRRRALGGRRRPPAAAGHLAGRRARGRRRQGDGEAPDRVRLRRDRGAAARRRRRLGRHQRAALPVAQGDHGREVEAAGDRVDSPTSALEADAGRRAAGSRTEVLRPQRSAARAGTR